MSDRDYCRHGVSWDGYCEECSGEDRPLFTPADLAAVGAVTEDPALPPWERPVSSPGLSPSVLADLRVLLGAYGRASRQGDSAAAGVLRERLVCAALPVLPALLDDAELTLRAQELFGRPEIASAR